MEKKTYIKPHMEVIDVAAETMFATSVNIYNSSTDLDASMGRQFHDNWDDLWD
jgi:hypothetical protein